MSYDSCEYISKNDKGEFRMQNMGSIDLAIVILMLVYTVKFSLTAIKLRTENVSKSLFHLLIVVISLYVLYLKIAA